MLDGRSLALAFLRETCDRALAALAGAALLGAGALAVVGAARLLVLLAAP